MLGLAMLTITLNLLTELKYYHGISDTRVIAHDGIDRVPASHEGTWLLRKDEMVLNPSQADDYRELASLAQSTGGNSGRQINYSPNISIDARNAVPGVEQKIRTEVETALRQYNAELESDFANGGPLSQRLNGLVA